MYEAIWALLKAGALPTVLLAIIGYFINKHFEETKEFQTETKQVRADTSIKLDNILKHIGTCNTEIAVIKTNLNNHVEADEKVQKHMDENIDKIQAKLDRQ